MPADDFVKPRWMGVWDSFDGGSGTFFIWSGQKLDDLEGEGMDRIGRFEVSGSIRGKNVKFVKKYLEKDHTIQYCGERCMENGQELIKGNYVFPDAIGRGNREYDGNFVMERYQDSHTMRTIVQDIGRELELAR